MDDDQFEDPTLQINRALLQYAQARMAAQQNVGATERLDLPNNQSSGEDTGVGDLSADIRELPINHVGNSPRWLITLGMGDAAGAVMRIKVMGDVALGVTRPPHPVPDLDLTALQAAEKGVSRRHAILRPGIDYLYLIPLQSTNGTRINGKVIPTGTTIALQHGDVISLGALHLALGIEAAPEHLRD